MGGDFIAFMVHQNPNYYNIDDASIDVKVTEQNMWRFPNLLEPVGLEAKVYPSSRVWAVDADSLNKLNEVYKDNHIMLPSHWYNRITPDMTNGLFDHGIRLYVRERKLLKVCYALWWLKSHIISNEIWPHRREEIDEMINSNHPKKDLLLSTLDSYHNWKVIAIKHDLLDSNGQLDLLVYIRRHFNELYSKANHTNNKLKYMLLELDDLIYGDYSNLTRLESYLDVKIDREIVDSYCKTNYQVLEQCLGFGVDSAEFDDDEKYFNAILNYSRETIHERANQFDYYNGKR